MSDTIDNILTKIIDREGRSYENVPGDRGGPTKFGITLGRLRTEWGRHVTWEAVRDLTEDQAREIYKRAYFERPRIGELPAEIMEFVLDWYVTSGTWAIKGLQNVLRDMEFDVPVNGVIDAETLDAADMAQRAMGDDFLRALIVERAHFFGRIVANDPSQKKFLKGWLTHRALAFWK